MSAALIKTLREADKYAAQTLAAAEDLADVLAPAHDAPTLRRANRLAVHAVHAADDLNDTCHDLPGRFAPLRWKAQHLRSAADTVRAGTEDDLEDVETGKPVRPTKLRKEAQDLFTAAETVTDWTGYHVDRAEGRAR